MQLAQLKSVAGLHFLYISLSFTIFCHRPSFLSTEHFLVQVMNFRMFSSKNCAVLEDLERKYLSLNIESVKVTTY